MKILCVTESLGSGGAERQLTTLAVAFKEVGHDVSFLVYDDNEFHAKTLIKNDITIIRVYNFKPINRILQIRKIIRKSNFDAVISYMIGPSFVCAMASFPYRNWKWISGERGTVALNYSLKTKIQRYFQAFSDVITTNSYKNLNNLIAFLPNITKTNSQVIYNALDMEKWKPIRKTEGKTSAKKTLVIAASHHKIKNGKGLIEGVHMLTETEKSNIVIKWFGGSLDEPYIDNSIIEERELLLKYHLQDIIHFYPASNNIVTEIQNSDGIGLFSFDEGLPNAICEGMACGKPIISTIVSDIPLFINDGINGFLCEANKPETIAGAIRQFINSESDKLNKMGMLNRIKAVELFDKNTIVNKYLDLIINI